MRRGSLACNEADVYVQEALSEDVKRLHSSNSAYISLGLSCVRSRPYCAVSEWQN